MPPRDWFVRFRDILEAIEKIESYLDGDFDYFKFENDSKTVDAVIRQLTVIGEASNHIPYEIQDHFSYIPWVEIVSLRNFVIHEYFGITLRTLWNTVKNDLPSLKVEITKIVEQGRDKFIAIPIRKKKRPKSRRKNGKR